ncbi:MAG: AbiV family abortive infection protein [Candidatus Kryptoniota bacterium]
MMKKREFTLTVELLNAYKENAIKNSTSLLEESQILFSRNRWARGYFLSCASIEEAGKAFLAFNSVNRNLSNAAVQHSIKLDFENHNMKLLAGLGSLMIKRGTNLATINHFLDINSYLLSGREKSLYADVNNDGTLTLPESLVPPKGAADSIRLAEDSLLATTEYMSNNSPKFFSAMDDKAYTISRNHQIQKLMSTSDFWYFYIDVISSKQSTSEDCLNVAIARYYERFYSKGKLWGKEKAP